MLSAIEKRDRIRWLLSHPVWDVPLDNNNKEYISAFEELVCTDYVFVNPDTNEIDADDSKNIAFRIWIEAGQPYDRRPYEIKFDSEWDFINFWGESHDIRLDCGASTIDEALLKLADLVEKYYGDGSSYERIKF